jgi:hypothetical protein
MTKLCPRGKAAAKKKFKVYPSAYANAYASRICAGKIKDPSGTKRKDWGPKSMKEGSMVKVKKFNPGALSTISPQDKQGPMLPESPTGFEQDFEKINQRTSDKFVQSISPYYSKGIDTTQGTFGSSIDSQTLGVDVGTKLGKLTLEGTKSTRDAVGAPTSQDVSKQIRYANRVGINENTFLDFYGNVGKTKSSAEGYEDQSRKTYGGGARITYQRKSGGMANEGRFKYVKGGFEDGNYQDYVDELIK